MSNVRSLLEMQPPWCYAVMDTACVTPDAATSVMRSLIAGVSSRHLPLSNPMVFSVVARREQRVFLPVPWFSPRSRHHSPHHGVRKLRGLNVTGAVLFGRKGIHGITRDHPLLRPGKGQGYR